MGELQWVANTYDPNRDDWELSILCGIKETRSEAVARTKDWLVGKTLGEPKATARYSVEELKAMGMVGVYVLAAAGDGGAGGG